VSLDRVEVVCVGDELLNGDVVNGNAAWLGQALQLAGFPVTRAVVVGDDEDETAGAVREGLARAGAVVLTGGLGPTPDDRTRAALARLAGVALRRDPASEQRLRAWFSDRGHRLSEVALGQADVPDGAALIPNPTGSAPGILLERPEGPVYALPGVPSELRVMVEASVLPDLRRRAGTPAGLAVRVLRTALVGESLVAHRLAAYERHRAGPDGVRVAYLAEPGEVRVRLTAHADTAAAAEQAAAAAAAQVAGLLGDVVVDPEGATLAEVAHRALAARGQTVATAESLTGGQLAGALTDTPGASGTLRGGVVAYATDLKSALLGVPEGLLRREGAVHPEVAVAMAAGVAARLGTDWGLATTGVAGPEPQDGRPVGEVYVAVVGPAPSAPVVASHQFSGDRARVRRLAVVAGLDLLRRRLAEVAPYDEARWSGLGPEAP